MGDEQTFFSDHGVLVTNSRVQFPGGKTFATANITSVWNEVEEPKVPSKMGMGCLIACGCITGFLGLVFTAESLHGGLLVMLLFGAGPVALGILGMRRINKAQRWHIIRIGSASWEQEGMRSTDAQLIAQVTEAINKAIVARG